MSLIICDFEKLLPEAIQAELREVERLLGVDPLIAMLEAIREDVREKPLASRFSKTRPVNHIYRTEYLGGIAISALEREGDTESTYKKAELEARIFRLISMLLRTITEAKSVVAEVRVSQMEF